MKSVLYKITYLPHLETQHHKYYIGSKHNYTRKYTGSVSSQQRFEYTGEMTLKDWWKQKNIVEAENFIFEVLETFDDITPQDLVILERDLQLKLDVVNSQDFFNQGIATEGWVSRPNTKESKKKKSIATKEYWNSDAGQEKRKRLIESNRKHSPQRMRDVWKTQRELLISNLNKPKTARHKNNISSAKVKSNPIEYAGDVYFGWKDLETKTEVTKFLYFKYYRNGIEPLQFKGKKHLTKDDYNTILSEYIYHSGRTPPSSEKDAQALVTVMTQLGIITKEAAIIIMEKEFWK
jgi:hypothetical protein